MATKTAVFNEIGEIKARLTGIIEDNELPEDVNKHLVAAWEMLAKAKEDLASDILRERRDTALPAWVDNQQSIEDFLG